MVGLDSRHAAHPSRLLPVPRDVQMKRLTALLCGTTIAASALAQSGFETVAPTSMGSCGQYMDGRRKADPQSEINTFWAVVWTWGYLSRYNRESQTSPLRIPADPGTIHLWLEKFCRDHPLANLLAAADALTVELGGNPAKSWPRK